MELKHLQPGDIVRLKEPIEFAYHERDHLYIHSVYPFGVSYLVNDLTDINSSIYDYNDYAEVSNILRNIELCTKSGIARKKLKKIVDTRLSFYDLKHRAVSLNKRAQYEKYSGDGATITKQGREELLHKTIKLRDQITDELVKLDQQLPKVIQESIYVDA
jgi:hypothetical protein